MPGRESLSTWRYLLLLMQVCSASDNHYLCGFAPGRTASRRIKRNTASDIPVSALRPLLSPRLSFAHASWLRLAADIVALAVFVAVNLVRVSVAAAVGGLPDNICPHTSV